MKPSLSPLFYRDPFSYIDQLDLSWKGLQANFFRDTRAFRKRILWTVLGMTVAWALMGWDSCAWQLQKVMEALWPVITGAKEPGIILQEYQDAYGKAMHWSAFVIYGLQFWALLRYYDRKLGLQGIRAVGLAMMFTLAGVGFYETGWQISYEYWQKQAWILKWEWPQLRILAQNWTMMGLGLITVLWVSLDDYGATGRVYHWLGKKWVFDTWLPKYRLNLDWKLVALVGLAAASWVFWWYYPGPVQIIRVQVLGNSVWTSSHNFPQTLYTVEEDLTDGLNAGVFHWVQDDLIHLVNVVNKALTALVFYWLARLKQADRLNIRPWTYF